MVIVPVTFTQKLLQKFFFQEVSAILPLAEEKSRQIIPSTAYNEFGCHCTFSRCRNKNAKLHFVFLYIFSIIFIFLLIATMKNTEDFHYGSKRRHQVQQPNQHFLLSAKMNGTQSRTLVSQ